MRSAILAALAAALMLFTIGCNQSETKTTNQPPPAPSVSPTATPDEFASARVNFAKHCEACHGETGDGGIVKVDNVRLKVPSLRKGHALKHTDEELAKQITNGGDGMPKFKDKLKPEDINELIRFIRHQFQSQTGK